MFTPRNIKQKITALVSLTVSTLTLDATILTFEIENKKFENYQPMPQEYGEHVNSQKSLSVDGLHHYIYKEGNNWGSSLFPVKPGGGLTAGG
ncbi:MAG: hypothetical protein EXS25_04440 [Pedosphaera sp.]|nr:hypothetical protein [Pedosphaera sp.]